MSLKEERRRKYLQRLQVFYKRYGEQGDKILQIMTDLDPLGEVTTPGVYPREYLDYMEQLLDSLNENKELDVADFLWETFRDALTLVKGGKVILGKDGKPETLFKNRELCEELAELLRPVLGGE